MDDLQATIQDLRLKLQASEAESQRAAAIQSALFHIADAASASANLPDFYARLHQIIGSLMPARNFFLALHDKTTDVLSFPYLQDEVGDVAPEPQPLTNFHGITAYLFRTMKPFHGTREINAEMVRRGEFELVGTAPEDAIGAPLTVDEGLEGLVVVQTYTPGTGYSDDDLELLTFVTQHISTALKRARDLEQIRRRNAELAILNSVGQAMAKSLDVKTLTRIVGDNLREIFGADVVSIWLLNRQTGMIRAVYEFDNGEGGYVHELRPPFPLGTGMSSKIIESRKPLLLGTLEEQMEHGAYIAPEVLAAGSGVITQSWLGVPIIAGDEVLGVASISEYRPRAYGEGQLTLLQTLSAGMGVAIQNARLFESEQQRVAELEIVNSVQQALASKLDLQSIYDLVGDKIREIFDAQVVTIVAYDAGRQLARYEFLFEEGRRFPPTSRGMNSFDKFFVESGETYLVNQDLAGTIRRRFPDVVPVQGDLPKSFLCSPLWRQGKVTGLVSLQNLAREHAFSESDVRLLGTLVNSASIALENAKLFDEVQRRNQEVSEALEQQTATSDILRVIASSPTEIQPVLDAVCQNAARLCDSYDVLIVRVEGDIYKAVAHWGPVPVWPAQFEEGFPLNRDTVTGRAILERRSIQVEDVLAEPPSEYLISKENSRLSLQRTLLATPLMREGKAIGAIALRRQEVNPFTEKQTSLLKTFADQAAIAIENVRLFNETTRLLGESERRAAELEIINSIQRGLAAKLDLDAIYNLVGAKMQETFAADTAYIVTYDAATESVMSSFYLEQGQRLPDGPLPFGQGIYSRVIKTGQAQMMGSLAEGIELGAVQLPSPGSSVDLNESGMYVPILHAGRVTGVASVQSHRKNAYTENDLRLLTTLAQSMSGALENARLFDEVQKRNQEITEALAQQTATSEILRVTANSPTDVQPVLEAVAERAARLCNSYDAEIALVEGDVYKVVCQWGPLPVPDASVRQGVPIDRTSVTGRAILEHRTVHVSDVMAESESEYAISREYGRLMGQRTVLATPLIREGRAIGAIFLPRLEVNPFTEKETALLRVFADQAAIAIENVRLFNETRRLLGETEQRAAELQIINSIQQGLSSQLDMQSIYDLVGEKVREIFNANTVVLATFDLENDIMYRHYSFESGQRFFIEPEPIPPIWSGFVQRGEATLIKRGQAELVRRIDPEFKPPAGKMPKSSVNVPLRIGGEVRGVISLQNVERENAFDEADLRLLSTLANSMSIALESARLFGETQRLLKETEQRNAELAVINSVQNALAAKLDIQAIYDAVGDKVSEIFPNADVGIRIYDPLARIIHFPYVVEGGRRIEIPPYPRDAAGITNHVLATREPLLINENSQAVAEKLGSFTIPGTAQDKSSLYVPLVVGQEAKGLISLQDLEREHAFSDSDVRLLTTVASSMSVALENARLFDEVQRRNREISEALEQQTATSEILSVMAASRSEIKPVLDAVARNAARLCEADDVQVYEVDGAQLRQVTHFGPLPALQDGEALPLTAGLVTGRAILEARTIQIEDAENMPAGEYPESAVLQRRLHHRSVISTPLLLQGRAIGAVVVRRNAVRPFTERQTSLLSTFASQAAIAIENVRLFNETTRLLKETNQRAAELEIINKVQQALASKLDMQAIYDLVGEEIRGVFDADALSIAAFDYEKQSSRVIYGYENGERFHDLENTPFTLANRHLMQTREPIVINENAMEAARQYGMSLIPGTAAPKSLVFVPFGTAQQVNGYFSLQNLERENAFSESDVRLLQTLAGSMGIALENARLFQAERQRAAELSVISTISQALVAETELDSMLQLIGNQLREVFAADIVYVALLDRQTNMIHFPYQFGDVLPAMPAGAGLAGKIMETGEPLLINQDIEKRRAELGTQRIGKQAASWLGVPILVGRSAIGVISVQSTQQENAFDADDMRLLSTIAANAGAAIQGARLHAETERRAQEMSALAEVGREISSSLDPAVVLEKIAGRAKDLLAASSSAVFLLDMETKTMRAITALGDLAGEIKADVLKLGEGIIGSLAAEGRAEFVNDTASDPRAVQIAGTQEVERENLMAAPLLKGEDVTGMMTVWRTNDRFSQSDLDFLTGLARQAAIALENARLFDQIKRQGQYLEAIVENSPVAIVTVDPESRVISWNPGAERLFGYKPDEAIGRDIDTLVASTDEMRLEARARGQQAASDVVKVNTQRARKDGSLVEVELSGVPLPLPSGASGLVAIYHDITDLQRARQEAIAANEAKSAFLATMSHEIRTPMNAVIGMSGLLMDTRLTDEQRDYAETIRSSGDALLAIINDILDFSKIEAGKMELEHQPFDLRECVESALDLVAPRAVDKSLDLAYVLEDDVPVGIRGDVTRLRQVLLNLLGNAVKFTEKGEVVVTVGRGTRPGTLRFTVRDTGIGISPDRIHQLFQSFTQADSSTTRRFGGTGLGLAISRRLVELMGGRLEAQSAGIDQGSTFTFTIEAEPVEMVERRSARLAAGIQPELRGRSVLIVDDNATNRRILMLQTSKWGMSPQAVSTPSEALRLVKDGPAFDVAILDLQMPEMDGIALSRELRKLPKGAGLPIVLLTSLGRKEIGTDEIGAVAFLTKPLKPSALFDALATVFVGKVSTTARPTTAIAIDPDLARKHPLRILVAEDNVVNQKLAVRLLDQMGYRADVASNGLEAVQSVQRQAYDVILMDVQMPELDGLDATRAIRKLPGLAQPRIVAITANALQGDREMCIAAGMDDYISKPIRVAELMDALQRTQSLAPRERRKVRKATAAKAPKKTVRAGPRAATRNGTRGAARSKGKAGKK